MSFPKIKPTWLENFHITVMDNGGLMIFDSWYWPIKDLIFNEGGLAKGYKLAVKGHEFTVDQITIQGNGFESEPYAERNIQLIIYTIEEVGEGIYANFDEILFDQ